MTIQLGPGKLYARGEGKVQGFAQYVTPKMAEWALLSIPASGASGGGFATIVITSLGKTPSIAE